MGRGQLSPYWIAGPLNLAYYTGLVLMREIVMIRTSKKPVTTADIGRAVKRHFSRTQRCATRAQICWWFGRKKTTYMISLIEQAVAERRIEKLHGQDEHYRPCWVYGPIDRVHLEIPF